eukprot:TRINITY_DN14723_c0_g1_i2.p1 TRINITY_DN14723_c0_g1~~TRINITY_DN14723_c0_g1_i2.p1  ORF type:complete len:719 (+),score=160.66 TRINITY_DN14723_c0_g1_i2:2-2158(+)
MDSVARPSSMCCEGEVVITTRVAGEETGEVIVLDKMGAATIRAAPQNTPVGTLVQVKKLFERTPVRFQRFKSQKSSAKECKRVFDMVSEYMMVVHNVKIILNCAPSDHHMKRPASRSMLESITEAWGYLAVEHLHRINARQEHTPPANPPSGSSSATRAAGQEDPDGDPPMHDNMPDYGFMSVEGYVPRPSSDYRECTRSSSERSYLFVNNRPVDIPNVSKVVNHFIRKWFSIDRHRYGVFVLSIGLPTNTYDINVSPDKRTILLHHETEFLKFLRRVLVKLYPVERDPDAFPITPSKPSQPPPTQTAPDSNTHNDKDGDVTMDATDNKRKDIPDDEDDDEEGLLHLDQLLEPTTPPMSDPAAPGPSVPTQPHGGASNLDTIREMQRRQALRNEEQARNHPPSTDRTARDPRQPDIASFVEVTTPPDPPVDTSKKRRRANPEELTATVDLATLKALAPAVFAAARQPAPRPAPPRALARVTGSDLSQLQVLGGLIGPPMGGGDSDASRPARTVFIAKKRNEAGVPGSFVLFNALRASEVVSLGSLTSEWVAPKVAPIHPMILTKDILEGEGKSHLWNIAVSRQIMHIRMFHMNGLELHPRFNAETKQNIVEVKFVPHVEDPITMSDIQDLLQAVYEHETQPGPMPRFSKLHPLLLEEARRVAARDFAPNRPVVHAQRILDASCPHFASEPDAPPQCIHGVPICHVLDFRTPHTGPQHT